MKVSELISILQNQNMDSEVLVLTEESDWGFDGNSSYEYTTTQWESVTGVENKFKNKVCIFANEIDLENNKTLIL